MQLDASHCKNQDLDRFKLYLVSIYLSSLYIPFLFTPLHWFFAFRAWTQFRRTFISYLFVLFYSHLGYLRACITCWLTNLWDNHPSTSIQVLFTGHSCLHGTSITATHTLQDLAGWPDHWPATPSYLMGFVSWHVCCSLRPHPTRDCWLPVCWLAMPSYFMGFVSWHICCSLRPHPTWDCWLARSLASHTLLPSRGSSADPSVDHCALILLGIVGWPVRWSATPSYLLGVRQQIRSPITAPHLTVFMGSTLSWPFPYGFHISWTCPQGFHISWAFLHGFHISWTYLHGFRISRTYLHGFHISWAFLHRFHISWAFLHGFHISWTYPQGFHTLVALPTWVPNSWTIFKGSAFCEPIFVSSTSCGPILHLWWPYLCLYSFILFLSPWQYDLVIYLFAILTPLSFYIYICSIRHGLLVQVDLPGVCWRASLLVCPRSHS